jgi:hypothetical protein
MDIKLPITEIPKTVQIESQIQIQKTDKPQIEEKSVKCLIISGEVNYII